MNWSEEKYVKLYTRDTVTWRSWSWQAKAVFSLLIRKVDSVGILETGTIGLAAGTALLLEMPIEVVRPGLEVLLSSGTAEAIENGLILPRFVEAQEARKNDRLRSSEYRERKRLEVTSKPPKSGEAASRAVTPHHESSQPVTLQPSPAQPSPAQKDLRAKKPRAAEKPVDPRHHLLKLAMIAMFAEMGHGTYEFDSADAGGISKLLSKGEPDEVVAHWRRALSPGRYPTVRTILELVKNWNHFNTDDAISASSTTLTRRGSIAPVRADPKAFPKTGDVTEAF